MRVCVGARSYSLEKGERKRGPTITSSSKTNLIPQALSLSLTVCLCYLALVIHTVRIVSTIERVREKRQDFCGNTHKKEEESTAPDSIHPSMWLVISLP